MPLKQHLDNHGFNGEFRERKASCATNLAKYATAMQSGFHADVKTLIRGISELAPLASDMPVVDVIRSTGEVISTATIDGVFKSEILLTEVRLIVLKGMLESGQQCFRGAWDSFSPLMEMLGDKP